ncbi:MAG: Protein kinase [Sclerophora amabilis]|nr:MAG: Protein kinase [Sclerophora amabilis]
MAPAFDDEDLSISLPANYNRRAQSKPPDAPSLQGLNHPPDKASHAPTQVRNSQRLGQYNIIKTLGEGSFGKVKLAVHQVSGQKVALKIINRRKLISRDMAGRVEREIQYLQLLRHPHIIKLYTVITTPNEIIMVLEYAGGELFEYLVQHGKINEESARRFFQQIICAVEYCHRHKIVHRDLKPENLLLDETLNVKIADFGLSNIMTDGNFLKTSCGSPNYAAPEVISGKLYAGPEVDVWSAGVILYVLLVGRLPFDDEYIPHLFKKIAQGTYTVPNYLSHGAVNLIRKMLVVNPVHRITVQEIRQDPWFTQALPEYLQPPVEEFIDTGVDPNKAINPRVLAPGKSPAVQEKLHEAVIGKLGKTMGYAKDDVQEALGKDEPSAIKDAYLIVRENQIMKTNPHLSNNEDLQPFLAQSPPPWNPGLASSPRPLTSGSPHRGPPQVTSPITRDIDRTASERSASGEPNLTDSKSPISNVSILPSSLPAYHRAYMKGLPTSTAGTPKSIPNTEGPPQQQSAADQAATARNLKPHSRSQLNLDKAAEKPDSLTPLPSRKPKPTKWQFGIRSRNQPLEAIACIFRALERLGAEWEESEDPEGSEQGDRSSRSREDRERHDSGDSSVDDRDGHGRSNGSSGHGSSSHTHHGHRDGSARRSSSGSSHHRRRSANPSGHFDGQGYLPEDPWVLHCRWLKDGMYPPGTVHPSSTHSSTVNLNGSGVPRQRSSTAGSISSTTGSTSSHSGNASHTGPGSVPLTPGSLTSHPEPNDSVWVYMDIQLYQLEKDFFLVDFKCAGYERQFPEDVGDDEAGGGQDLTTTSKEGSAHNLADPHSPDGNNAAGIRHGSSRMDGKPKRMRGAGRRTEEKDVSSPFPFLDLASKLIIALAEAD